MIPCNFHEDVVSGPSTFSRSGNVANKMQELHKNTPEVVIFDNRGNTVRNIAFHRHPDTPDITDERIIRHTYNLAGSLIKTFSPRQYDLFQGDDTVLPSQSMFPDLTGVNLCTEGADDGRSFALVDCNGRPVLSISPSGAQRRWKYEDSTLPGRIVSISEQTPGDKELITERFIYAGNTKQEKDLNLVGQCVSHYDSAGLVKTQSIALTGMLIAVTRQLINVSENQEAIADWQGEDASKWNTALAQEVYTDYTYSDATGAILTTIDAKNNKQRVAYDCAGQLKGRWISLSGNAEQVIIKSVSYSAAGLINHEEHGNGIIKTYHYEPETQRLIRMTTARPVGHNAGASILQDLEYEYDPVGNVVFIRNNAEVTRFWRNQRVEPERKYVYDTLYQLVHASGREMAGINQQRAQSLSLDTPIPTDNSAYTNYTRTYTYDRGDNLIKIQHHSAASNNSYTQSINISNRSNRGVSDTLKDKPSEVEDLFTSGGEQKLIRPGQGLNWSVYGVLKNVTQVQRETDIDDSEHYLYNSAGQRVIKTSIQKKDNAIQIKNVLYLSGMEIRTTHSGSINTENLQVIDGGSIRVLHWSHGKPDGVDNDQYLWNYSDSTGGFDMELDINGEIVSREEYYPYGCTACWSARNAIEANYKILRYSGKELDATGMYYYGDRYYIPWLGRWLSADPQGTIDGPNLYIMCSNNPISFYDDSGNASEANKKRSFFRLATFVFRKKGEGMSSSLNRGLKITRAVFTGIALAGIAAGIAAAIVGTAGIALAVGAGAFAIGASVGWNLGKITSAGAKLMAKMVQGKSVKVNTAAGAGVAAATAAAHGARPTGVVVATAVGAASGAVGGYMENSDRGMGGAHAAAVAVATVDTLAGDDTSVALETGAATGAAVAGYLTGVEGSEAVGRNAGYGSYILGMSGRVYDNITPSFVANGIINPIVKRGVEQAVTGEFGDNVITRAVASVASTAVADSVASTEMSTNGTYEWAGSITGGLIGGLGTASIEAAPDPHFQKRVKQAGEWINWAGGQVMDLVSGYVIRTEGAEVAKNVATGVANTALKQTVGYSFA